MKTLTFMGKVKWLLCFGMIFGGVAFSACFLTNAIKIAVTQNRAAKIQVALGKTLGKKPFAEYDLTAELLEHFPEAPVKDGGITDEWGRVMTLKIERVSNEFHVWVRSAGPDRKIGTKDDVVRGIVWGNEPDLLESIEEGVIWDRPLVLGINGSFPSSESLTK